MGIFSRFADIVSSNVSSLLDKAEDPEKMIKLIIQEMEDTLVEVRTHSAKAMADKVELSRQIDDLQAQIQDWGNKAALALSKDREDLARAALIEKQKVFTLVENLKNDDILVEESIVKLSAEISKLESKITETRAKQQALVMRNESAQNRRSVQRHLHGKKLNDTLQKLESYTRKVDVLEAEAELYGQANDGKDLHKEFAELCAQDEIDKQLAELKRQAKGSS